MRACPVRGHQTPIQRQEDGVVRGRDREQVGFGDLLDVLGRDQLVRLVGVSPSSVARSARGELETPDAVAARVHFLALVVGDLASTYKEIGIRRWFERTRTVLEGRAPAAVLHGEWQPEDPGPLQVRDVARALVASAAT